MKINIIVLKAKIDFMFKSIIKLWYIINHNGTHNNEYYYEDMIEMENDIDKLYKQASMSENDYNEYTLKYGLQLDIDVFNESVKI